MPKLLTHDAFELLPVNGDRELPVVPGSRVAHRCDPGSFGTVLSRRVINESRSIKCEVLWSLAPVTCEHRQRTRSPLSNVVLPASAIWRAHEKYVFRLDDNDYEHEQILYFDGIEEFESGSLSANDIGKARHSGGSVTMHCDGKIEIRWSNVREDWLPVYMNNSGQQFTVRSSYAWRHDVRRHALSW